ncbi:MAG: hypothetical protein GKR89_23280 [Candidatus Latescibacteria bacterium]|nr:hypothetical protein [Candidatus Latescibacterota bacterium]
MAGTIHHIRLNVCDLDRSAAFYQAVLEGVGWTRQPDRAAGGGDGRRVRFRGDGVVLLLGEAGAEGAADRTRAGLHHLAFRLDSAAAVDRFYAEVLHGLDGVYSEDPPVACPEYGAGYYATFFYDPDGNKLEVTYTPEEAS